MKKNQKLATALMVILALAIGFMIGLFVNYPGTNAEDAAGSIGKVEKYRNVKVTDKDIQLRNDLLSDTALCHQYKKYLMYYYYQSLKLATDMEAILERTTADEPFHSVYYPYADAMRNFQVYTEAARQDILQTLALISQLEENKDVPVINYMNQAHNAVSRIRNHNSILMDYMNAINTFVSDHPQEDHQNLQQAYNIIYFHLVQSAVTTQDKPLMHFLTTIEAYEGEQDAEEVLTKDEFEAVLSQAVLHDLDLLVLLNDKEQLGALLDADELSSFINNSCRLQFMADSEILGLFGDQENLKMQLQSLMLDAEKLGAIIWTDSEKLRLMESQNLGMKAGTF